MICTECDRGVESGDKGFTADDLLVHISCVKAVEVPCRRCWLIHVGTCDF